MNQVELNNFLTNTIFQYGDFGKIAFHKNGDIGMYITYNERYWKLIMDERTKEYRLFIYGDDGTPTSIFKHKDNFFEGVVLKNRNKKIFLKASEINDKSLTREEKFFTPNYFLIDILKKNIENNLIESTSRYKKICLIHHYPTMYLNIGDAIQYIAMRKLLEKLNIKKEIRYTYRDFLKYHKPLNDEILIINGCMTSETWCPEKLFSDVLFLGIHGGNDTIYKWLKISKFKIFSRDFFTKQLLEKNNIENDMNGCVTLTMEAYSGKREGIYCGDCTINHDNSTVYSHICSNLFPIKQNILAEKMLANYKTAKLVYTSKLHCALPCIAFKTPLVLKNMPNDGRTDLLNYLSN